jgi:hypothetical protein
MPIQLLAAATVSTPPGPLINAGDAAGAARSMPFSLITNTGEDSETAAARLGC